MAIGIRYMHVWKKYMCTQLCALNIFSHLYVPQHLGIQFPVEWMHAVQQYNACQIYVWFNIFGLKIHICFRFPFSCFFSFRFDLFVPSHAIKMWILRRWLEFCLRYVSVRQWLTSMWVCAAANSLAHLFYAFQFHWRNNFIKFLLLGICQNQIKSSRINCVVMN